MAAQNSAAVRIYPHLAACALGATAGIGTVAELFRRLPRLQRACPSAGLDEWDGIYSYRIRLSIDV